MNIKAVQGNVTGVSCFSAELAVKRVELPKDAIPGLRRIGFLYDPRNSNSAQRSRRCSVIAPKP